MKRKESILIKIKSKYILEHITSYIKEEHFIYKLIFYNKSFHKKLDIKNYFFDVFSREKIYFEDYLCSSHFNEIYYFNSSKLKNNFNNNLLRINIGEQISNLIIFVYFINKIKSLREESEYKLIDIDFYSPYFDFLSKKNIFEYFNIIISFHVLKEYKLSEDYIMKFNSMKKNSRKYPGIEFDFEEIKDLNDLESLSIEFNKIKKVKFIKKSQSENKKYNYNYFFNKFFSLFNSTNLVYLEINIFENEKNFIDNNLFEGINNYKNLEYLNLKDFRFNNEFIFKLYNLKNLSLFSCENIRFEDNSLSKLIHLELEDTKLKINTMLKLPKLKEIIIHVNNEVDYNKVIDFSSLNNLKYFKGHHIYFFNLKDTLLESVHIYRVNDCLTIKDILQKLISIRTLKEFNIHFKEIKHEDILKLEGENLSVNKINIRWDNDCLLNDLQYKFPNSTELNIISEKKSNIENFLTIKEALKIKTNKISISLNSNTELYCQSFDKLKSIDICSDNKILNLEKLPIIINDQKVYSSLIDFSFNYSYGMKFNILNNIYNNINNMPNLQNFFLDIRLIENIDEDFFKNFIRKILHLKSMKGIKINFFSLKTFFYSLKELIILFPDINFNRFNTVTIRKLEENKI